MEWDLGLQGIGLLLLMALGFGVLAQVLLWWATPHWFWIPASLAYLASGLFVSEVWFGWATEEDLQPNVGGLSFDEVLLLAPLVGLPVLALLWFFTRRMRTHAAA
jgi:hypothetical protein